MEMMRSIVEAGSLYFPLEMVSAAVLFSWPLARRQRFALRMALYILGLIAICAAFFQAAYRRAMEDAVSGTGSVQFLTLVWCIILFVVCALLVWRSHEVHLREAVYCAACAYLMEHMAYCFRILLRLALPGWIMEPGAWGYWLTHIVVYGGIYVLFARRIIRDGKLSATAVDSLALTLTTLAIVLAMSILATAYDFEPAHAVYASFCCGALLFGQVKQQQQIKAQSELALQRQMWSLHRTQYEMSKASIDAINRKCHDLKHQVAALKLVRDPTRREEVIDSLQASVMIYDAVVETGNEILDTVLTEKSLICGRDEIALSVLADGEKLSFLDPVDLYTLVGNAMDNAIEAVQLLPEPERLISLRVQERAGMVFLRLQNPYMGNLVMRDGLPVTHKEDAQSHGFGLRSIRDISKKYHGILRFSTEDGQFALTITFPLCEQQSAAEN